MYLNPCNQNISLILLNIFHVCAASAYISCIAYTILYADVVHVYYTINLLVVDMSSSYGFWHTYDHISIYLAYLIIFIFFFTFAYINVRALVWCIQAKHFCLISIVLFYLFFLFLILCEYTHQST